MSAPAARPPEEGGAPLDVLAVGSHPDDVELACGGTLARLARDGKRVGILHLTRGESGTRGTPAGRRREAERAAEALGAVALELLDCGDAALRTGRAEEDAVITVLRRWRPELVLGPPPADRHPDHARAHRLLVDACFYAGLAGRPNPGEPHRPGALFHYMQHDDFEPAFVVDVTDVWEAKLAALACYESQLYRGDRGGDRGEDSRDAEPQTKVSSRLYARAVEGRARHYGLLINAELGEPFGSRGPLAVPDPTALVPGGLR